ncbi:MAG TPA: hypothetical protein VMP01_14460 [Pirellulaceae bacterium]|nr:hypothetical protein [Pirellulaceae bacterium]
MLLRALKSFASPRSRRRRLLLEILEDRTLLATVPLAAAVEQRGLVIDPASYHPSRVLVRVQPGANAGEHRWQGMPVAAARPLLGDLWEVDASAMMNRRPENHRYPIDRAAGPATFTDIVGIFLLFNIRRLSCHGTLSLSLSLAPAQ